MAIVSPLKGREVPGHKYVRREVSSNGSYKYFYSNSAEKAKSVSSLRKGETQQENSSRKRDTSWADVYLANRNRKVSSFEPASVSKGKSAASSKVKTTSEKWDTKVTRATLANEQPTKEQFKEAYDKLEAETNQKKTSNETYYKNLYEQEKEQHKNKLLKKLQSTYGNNIPEEEMNRVNEQVEKDTSKLWDDVYKPLVDKVNGAIDDANKAVMRILRRKYEQED